MCDWGRELSSSSELLPDHMAKQHLVIPDWLDPTSDKEESKIDSIFALRDFMLQEALSVVKFA